MANQRRREAEVSHEEARARHQRASGVVLDSPAEHAGAAKLAEYPLSDAGNAERLVARHGHEIRSHRDARSWLIWQGARWIPDLVGQIVQFAKATARSIQHEAAQAQDQISRHALLRHSLASEAASRLDAMVRLARFEPGIAVLPEDLDSDPWLLNAANGTVDLRSGRLLPHRAENLITKISPYAFEPGTEAPLWAAHLARITGSDSSMLEYLRRVAGCWAAGVNPDQVAFVLHGAGQNGRSTFVGALQDVLGDYALQAEAVLFDARRRRSIPNDIARLRGARVVVVAEMEEDAPLAEGFLKQATGGQKLTARLLFKEFFEFVPGFTPVFDTNHRPEVRGTEDGIWRRIQLVEFKNQIPPADRDLHFGERLRVEGAGILAWLVEGCLAWQDQGLTPPETVISAGRQYRREQDVIGRFLDESCVIRQDLSVRSADLYRAYVDWCASSGERPASQTKLGSKLRGRGFVNERIGSPQKHWVWHGIDVMAGLAGLAGLSRVVGE